MQIHKVKCDRCREEREMKKNRNGFHLPKGWIELDSNGEKLDYCIVCKKKIKIKPLYRQGGICLTCAAKKYCEIENELGVVDSNVDPAEEEKAYLDYPDIDKKGFVKWCPIYENKK